MEEKRRYCAYCGREIKDGERHYVSIDGHGNTVYTCRKCLRTALLVAAGASATMMLLICLLAAVIS